MSSLYKTETRHRSDGKTCHHFMFHRLTCDEYDELRARANGHCEICGIAEGETKRGSLVVDHCITEGLHVVRGMLCDYCNTVVMRCYEGRKSWSAASRQWEAKAREYVANSWQTATPEAIAQLAEIIARAEERAERKRNAARGNVIPVPAKRGVPAMARCLRRWLTPRQVAELARLLSGEPE